MSLVGPVTASERILKLDTVQSFALLVLPKGKMRSR